MRVYQYRPKPYFRHLFRAERVGRRLERGVGLAVVDRIRWDFALLCESLVLLAKISNQQKGTLSCVDAAHRCPARLRPKEDSRKLAVRRTTQTSGRLFLFRPPLLGAAPKGKEYRQRVRVASFRFCLYSAPSRSDGDAQRRRVSEVCLGAARCLKAAKAA